MNVVISLISAMAFVFLFIAGWVVIGTLCGVVHRYLWSCVLSRKKSEGSVSVFIYALFGYTAPIFLFLSFIGWFIVNAFMAIDAVDKRYIR